MSVTNHGEFASMAAATDYSANQYFLVKQTGDQEVTLAGDGQKVFGVLQNEPKAGETASVLRANSGVQGKVLAGGTFSRGNRLASNASGKAVVATASEESFGIAMSDGVDGEIVPFYFEPFTVPAS